MPYMMSLVTRFGTGIARTLASDYPGRVKQLILVAPAGAAPRSATHRSHNDGVVALVVVDEPVMQCSRGRR